jgi:DNA-binding transcriptional LysR family regulator
MTRLEPVELRQLGHFIAIAEDGSFTKAALRLSYVQSALSVSVQGLERELSVRLFDRTTHRVTLTAAGEALLPAARRALAGVEEIRDIAAAVRGVLRGALRVGIMQSFTFADVPGLLGAFHRQHPEVEIQVRPSVGGSAALVEELRQGGIDIAFIALVDPPSGVTAIPMGSEDLVVVTTPEQALPGRRPVTLDALAGARFVDFPPGWGIRTVVDRAFAAAGLDRRVTIEVADVATFLQLLRAGLGIALLPPSVLASGEPHLKQRAVSPPITWHVVMATPAGRSVNAAANALAELVTRSAPAIPAVPTEVRCSQSGTGSNR